MQTRIPTNQTVRIPAGFSVVIFGANGKAAAMTLPTSDRNRAARRGALLFSDIHRG